MRTIVYIDGFNLYYRALKGTAHKWLNVRALAEAALPSECRIARVNYYTAHISGRTYPTAPARQHAYLRALASLPGVNLYFGNFMVQRKWAGIVPPPSFMPPVALPECAAPQVVRVWKTEEKGSDVNLGVHLVRDACLGAFDTAAILTNDTDLTEAVRIVVQDIGLPLILLAPSTQPARSLSQAATSMRHITPYLGPCHLPDPVIVAGKPIAKPADW